MVTSSKITANDIIAVELDIKVATQGITTQTTIMTTIIRAITATDVADAIINVVTTTTIVIIIIITTVIIIVAIANSITATATVIIYITNVTSIITTTSYHLVRPVECTLRDRRGAASK
jgi:hypothetical protein